MATLVIFRDNGSWFFFVLFRDNGSWFFVALFRVIGYSICKYRKDKML